MFQTYRTVNSKAKEYIVKRGVPNVAKKQEANIAYVWRGSELELLVLCFGTKAAKLLMQLAWQTAAHHHLQLKPMNWESAASSLLHNS